MSKLIFLIGVPFASASLYLPPIPDSVKSMCDSHDESVYDSLSSTDIARVRSCLDQANSFNACLSQVGLTSTSLSEYCKVCLEYRHTSLNQRDSPTGTCALRPTSASCIISSASPIVANERFCFQVFQPDSKCGIKGTIYWWWNRDAYRPVSNCLANLQAPFSETQYRQCRDLIAFPDPGPDCISCRSSFLNKTKLCTTECYQSRNSPACTQCIDEILVISEEGICEHLEDAVSETTTRAPATYIYESGSNKGSLGIHVAMMGFLLAFLN